MCGKYYSLKMFFFSEKAHESTEIKKSASKDTTILICLFVAVVIVGVLAFGYNFIKKRKQQNRELERVEKGGQSPPSLKRSFERSLQNVQNLVRNEPEAQEMKPLISEKIPENNETVTEARKENGATGITTVENHENKTKEPSRNNQS